MRYNRIGDAETPVSEISFGAGSSAGLMIRGDPDEQAAAVKAALDAGINHFDTAAFYGYGASEIYLGQALRRLGVGDVLLTSKVAISPQFLETGEIRNAVRQSVEQSLSRLRRERIDMLLVHNATHSSHAPYEADVESPIVAETMNRYIPAVTFEDLAGDDGVRAEVDLLIEEGKVGQFGLSGQDNEPDVIRKLIGADKIDLFNQTYSLLNPSAGFPEIRRGRRIAGPFATEQRELYKEFDDIIEDARSAGVGVSVISPFAAGALTDAALRGEAVPEVSKRTNRFPWEGQFERMSRLAGLFAPIADEAGISLLELAARFVLSTPGVSTMVVGLSDAGQVRELAALADKPRLPPDMYEAIFDIWFGYAGSRNNPERKTALNRA